ncbi:MAG: META domain-containing protein, partial [Anaerolineales bacterium]
MKKNVSLIVIAVGLAALSLGACASSSAELQGTEWQWVSLIETMPASQSMNPDSQDYTITFTDAENVAIKADCNMVLGTFSVSGSKMSITTSASTLAYCGEDSQDVYFLDLISKVSSFEVADGNLQLGLSNDAGTMGFSRLVVDLLEDPTGANLTADVNVNVRSGPGIQFRVVHIALQGDQGQTIGSSPDDAWWAVPMPPDNPYYEIAWVSKSVTTLSNPKNVALPTITPPLLNTVYIDPLADNVPQATVLERAEVFTGPGSKYQLVGLTSMGADVKIIGKAADGSWWLIELP